MDIWNLETYRLVIFGTVEMNETKRKKAVVVGTHLSADTWNYSLTKVSL